MDKKLHAFRAFAIINVVACHALSEQVWLAGGPKISSATNSLNALTEALFHGSTLYFALISGLLFSLFLVSKGLGRFFSNKSKYVLLPYLCISLFFSVFVWQQSHFLPVFYSGNVSDFMVSFGHNLIYGQAMFHLWYLPVLFILFLLTPVLFYLQKSKYGTFVLCMLSFLPFLFSRTWPAMSLATVIYFMGAYALGMLVGQLYKRALKLIEDHARAFRYVAAISTLALIYLYYIGFDTDDISLIEGLSYLQKIAISAWVLNYLVVSGRQIPSIILLLGSYAFTILFFTLCCTDDVAIPASDLF